MLAYVENITETSLFKLKKFLFKIAWPYIVENWKNFHNTWSAFVWHCNCTSLYLSFVGNCFVHSLSSRMNKFIWINGWRFILAPICFSIAFFFLLLHKTQLQKRSAPSYWNRGVHIYILLSWVTLSWGMCRRTFR